jgi:hypothetical protein
VHPPLIFIFIHSFIHTGDMAPPPLNMEDFSKNDFLPSHRIPQQTSFQPFWVQLPDSHTNKFPFVKDNLPVRIILPPVQIAQSTKSQGFHPYSLSISPVMFHKVLFTNSRYTFGTQDSRIKSCTYESLRP